MSAAPPIMFRWQGGAFVPSRSGWAKLAARHFKEGEEYALIEHHDRSMNSHAHYFAAVNEAWKNLPEILAQEFPSPTHLRKYALIKAGFYTSNTFVCGNQEVAQRMAAFMQPMDEFSIITVEGGVVTRYTAKSQSFQSMGREEFKKSKEAVLDVLASMIETSREALEQNAGAAA